MGGGKERSGERERLTDRQTDKQTQRERDTHTHMNKHSQDSLKSTHERTGDTQKKKKVTCRRTAAYHHFAQSRDFKLKEIIRTSITLLQQQHT